jgi:uncharacterized protein YegP (UPF0339 family)/sporulation protein YlmC with PRC-barrel domain
MRKYLVPARRLEAYDVVNNSGQDLGQVQDFMVDMTTGRVAYAVVAFGGTLGFSDKWIAMPFEALCWSPDRRKFTVDLDPEVLRKAPGIEKDKWPDHYAESDTGWMNDLYNHYSCKPYWGNDTMAVAAVAPAPVEKEAVKPLRTSGKFEVFRDNSGEFRFRLIAANGQIISVSEGYKTKASAFEGIRSVVANAATAATEDLTVA